MKRTDAISKIKYGMPKEEALKYEVEQMSTIIGSIPPKPLMRRSYKTISSVHKLIF
jgi:hypothetical protein